MVAKSTWRTTLAFCLAWTSLAAFGGETDCADVRTDVVDAAERWPELFRAKVKAIYLNAGTADDSDGQEYNVLLDPRTVTRRQAS